MGLQHVDRAKGIQRYLFFPHSPLHKGSPSMTWLLRNFILALSGNDTPLKLAFGALLGWCWGFCPIKSSLAILMLVLILIFKVNFSLSIAAFLCAKALSFPLFGLQNELGSFALNSGALQGLWTSFYNTPYLAISGYNHPTVMGGLVLGLIFGIVGFPFIMKFTPYYREKILPKLQKLWIIKVLKGSKIFTTLT
jgi:uncharacterized protein (TIGR03546 family)